MQRRIAAMAQDLYVETVDVEIKNALEAVRRVLIRVVV